jgi:hypothetical protein
MPTNRVNDACLGGITGISNNVNRHLNDPKVPSLTVMHGFPDCVGRHPKHHVMAGFIKRDDFSKSNFFLYEK